MKTMIFFLLLAAASLTYGAEELSCKALLSGENFAVWEEKELQLYTDNIKKDGTISVEEFWKINEDFAIKSYTGFNYTWINQALRNDNIDDIKDTVMTLCLALSRLPNYTGVSFRMAEYSGSLLNYYKQNLNQVITEKAFLSSSSNRLGVRTFMRSVGERANIEFVITSLSGKQIRNYSYKSMEYEVLYPAGSKFLITSIKPGKKENSLTKIWMKQVE